MQLFGFNRTCYLNQTSDRYGKTRHCPTDWGAKGVSSTCWYARATHDTDENKDNTSLQATIIPIMCVHDNLLYFKERSMPVVTKQHFYEQFARCVHVKQTVYRNVPAYCSSFGCLGDRSG